MQSHEPNPYSPSGLVGTASASKRRLLNRITTAFVCYWILSAVTLPMVRHAWLGSIPVLAPLQLPKVFLKSLAHESFSHAVNTFGWSTGSASPDYAMIHPWAMVLMLTFPAFGLICATVYRRTGRTRNIALVAIITSASLDALVTLRFDALSSLKIFNASFF